MSPTSTLPIEKRSAENPSFRRFGIGLSTAVGSVSKRRLAA
jgi:hypothetical protein